jgi:hypothetical protein
MCYHYECMCFPLTSKQEMGMTLFSVFGPQTLYPNLKHCAYEYLDTVVI